MQNYIDLLNLNHIMLNYCVMNNKLYKIFVLYCNYNCCSLFTMELY